MTPTLEKKLYEFLLSRRHTPFCWGKHDCCLFVADALKAVYDVDIAADFRGKYSTDKGAYKALKKIGGGDIKSTFNHLLGPPKTPLKTVKGDVVLIKNERNEDTVGICFMGVWVATENGLMHCDMDLIVCSWGGEQCLQ